MRKSKVIIVLGLDFLAETSFGRYLGLRPTECIRLDHHLIAFGLRFPHLLPNITPQWFLGKLNLLLPVFLDHLQQYDQCYSFCADYVSTVNDRLAEIRLIEGGSVNSLFGTLSTVHKSRNQFILPVRILSPGIEINQLSMPMSEGIEYLRQFVAEDNDDCVGSTVPPTDD